MKSRIQTRGASRVGVCNICGETAKLTDDHIPPRSCGAITDAEARMLHESLDGDAHYRAPRRFQAGLTFRTLCGRCNNRLGSEYDPALAQLCRLVQQGPVVRSRVPFTHHVRVRPKAIMKSVLGHMAAQGVGRFDKGPWTEPLKRYLLEPDAPHPSPLRLYYWVYPHNAHVLVRDAAIGGIGQPVIGTFAILKFFPIGFLATTSEPEIPWLLLPNLHTYGDVADHAVFLIDIPFRKRVPITWPESPGDAGMIMYHSDHALRIAERAAEESA